MGNKDKVLWRINIALYVAAIAFSMSAVIAVKCHRYLLSAYMAVLGIMFFVVSFIMDKKVEKNLQETISNIPRMMSELGLIATNAENHPWLDKSKLNQWTSESSDLDFTEVHDCKLSMGKINVEDFNVPESFTRFMANKELKCSAEISQSSYPKTGIRDMVYAVVTFFKSGEQCRTSNGKASLINLFRELGVNADSVPGASPAELLKLHLAQRDKFAAEYNLALLDNFSFEVHQQYIIKHKERVQNCIEEQISRGDGSYFGML